MSTWAVNWAYEQTVKPATRKFVLVSLANFADENGYCFPSQQTLANMTDQGVSTVREHLKSLEVDGLITREHRYTKAQGGGRTSDGFYLQAPADRLKPPSKTLPPKAGGKSKQVTAETGEGYRQDSAGLPPRSGDDHIEEPTENKKTFAHAGMMKVHADHLKGKIPDPQAQAAAAKWLVDSGYSVAQVADCYAALLTQPWRTSAVSLLTVKKEIGGLLAKLPPRNGEKIVADYGDWYLVESSCGDGGTSPRYRTPEAFARQTGRDLETVRAGWN